MSAPHPRFGPARGRARAATWVEPLLSLAVVLPALCLVAGLLGISDVQAAADKSATVTPPKAATPLPTASELESRIKMVESTPSLDEATKGALLDAYRRTLANLESAAKLTVKASDFSKALEDAPAQTAKLRKQLEDGDKDPGPADLAASPELAADEIVQRLAKAQTAASQQESQIADLDKAIESSGTRPKEGRARIAELRRALEELDAEAAKSSGEQSTDLNQANGWALAARRQSYQAEIRMLEQELASQGAREELYRAQRERSAQVLRGIKERQAQLVALQADRRKADAEQAQRDAEAAQREAADKHPLVQQAVEHNAEITAALGHRAEQLQGYNDALEQIDRERKRVEGDFRGARERIEAAGLNQALGQILIDRRNQLPDRRQIRKEIATRDESIAEASLRQIRYREEQTKLRDLDEAVDTLARTDPSAQSVQVRSQLKEALAQRRTLLDKAIAAEDDYIRKQGQLNYAADQLLQVTQIFDSFLAENLLWVRSALPVGMETLTALPMALAWLTSPGGWKEVGEVLVYELARSPLGWLGLGAVALLLWNYRRLRRAILETAEPLRRVRTDRFRYTLRAMGLTILAAAPIPLLFVVLGRELGYSTEATPFTRAVGYALTQVSIGFYYLRAFRLLCLPGGLADRHFRWETWVLVLIRSNLRWFTPIIVSVSLLAITLFQGNDSAHTGSLGRLTLIAGMISVAVFFARLFNPRSGVFKQTLSANPEGWVNRTRNLWYPLVVGTPAALAVLAVIGYVFTAGTLFRSLVASAWLALGLVVLHQAIVRWLVVTRRRLALQAALERQAARRAQADSDKSERADSAGPAAQVEESEVDWAALDEQTRTLINAVVAFLSFFGIWLIWADVLPAFNVLDQIALWHTEQTVNGVAKRLPVTVGDLLLVLAIMVIGAVAAKNLPALLEIVLLQATNVTAGSRYAIRTLTSYAITIVAMLAAFGTLGLSWSQVQWLVAALSVGIGFGLQEIVANFISGIIILFERPVRVGDVITIANTTGVVTNIEIRATTIRNWDRQEFVVPNKELITGNLLNWTLADPVSRVVIPVGIDYGTDARLALALLTRAAEGNPRVLGDPAPTVAFAGFGDNALMLELRCFVGSLDDRVPATTELHLAIAEILQEHGIGIAYPQRDVHLTATKPLEVRLSRTSAPHAQPMADDAATPATGSRN